MTLPVIAAIPNYNMSEQLNTLLPQVMEAGYDDIYVLDDNSMDDSREVTASISTDITFFPGGENKGAGANRNRILGVLGHEATVHFIDADTDLETEDAARVVKDALPAGEYGYIGGLAKTGEGRQTIYNYGPRQSLYADIGSNVLALIDPIAVTNPDKAAWLRARCARLLTDWPNPSEIPVRREVFWVVEQNMVVNSETFRKIGGFDEALREHETQDLAIRMAAAGLKSYFDPSFAITHKAVNVRDYNRRWAMIKTELAIARKHGLLNWLMPDGSFRPEI